jgi:hypothetical protein
MSFLRHWEMYRNDVIGKGRDFAAAPRPLITPMTLQLVIPWRVALQQSSPPLRQPIPILHQTTADAKDLFGSGRTKDLEGHSAPHFQTAAVTLNMPVFCPTNGGKLTIRELRYGLCAVRIALFSDQSGHRQVKCIFRHNCCRGSFGLSLFVNSGYR